MRHPKPILTTHLTLIKLLRSLNNPSMRTLLIRDLSSNNFPKMVSFNFL